MKLINHFRKPKEKRTLILVRHGNDSGDDRSLNELGIKQASKLSEKLKNEKFDHIYTSDLKRAFQTFNIIQEKQKNQNISVVK